MTSKALAWHATDLAFIPFIPYGFKVLSVVISEWGQKYSLSTREYGLKPKFGLYVFINIQTQLYSIEKNYFYYIIYL